MKYLVFYVVLAFSSLKASAQVTVQQYLTGRANAEEPSILAKDAIKLVGKDVYVYDVVDSYQIVSDSLSIAYIGKRPTSQLLVVIFKGIGKKLNLTQWLYSKLHVSGKVILYDGKPAIIVTDATQLAIQIQI
jgi:hypothetical protein